MLGGDALVRLDDLAALDDRDAEGLQLLHDHVAAHQLQRVHLYWVTGVYSSASTPSPALSNGR